MENIQNNLELLVKRIPEIKKYFVPGTIVASDRMIYKDSNFIEWKNNVIFNLEKLPKNEFIDGIVNNLKKFNGYGDERRFNEVSESLKIIVSNFSLSEGKAIKLKKDLSIFSAFNTYKLNKQVGQGGNGKVWEAIDKNENKWAIKILERNNSVKNLKRFKNETFFCIKHNHENILPIHDYGTIGEDYIFYVMPLYKETLRDKINNKISPEDAINVFVGIIEGLKFAHMNNVIHRDIKPENILFADGSLMPVIADFGIAHFDTDDLVTLIETKKGDRLANFQYSAPEQRKKGGICVNQTDIYAAALILNEMFTGDVPQAEGYKKIGDVNKDYSYLDQLFSDMFKQEAKDRLYPENKIIAELNVLRNKYASK